ncbi:hypothetical protein [Sphingobacterium sp. SYP-B4668]|uniref:hypothetical protein n=1 Tax=Sphingobacterium sp. SYP-B4668 TaxID=2996035 RepID=UPI0022DE3A10|nr:hypothetical protein [Sphingobacterium sp. SYP-B4668]
MKSLFLAFLAFFILSSCSTLHSTSNSTLIRDCPEEKIVNRMPGPPAKGDKDKSYYIYKGKRKNLSEFDSKWIDENCDVKETVVY